jgi:hypothetical protein
MIDVIVLKSIYGQPIGAITHVHASELAELKSGGYVKEVEIKVTNKKG